MNIDTIIFEVSGIKTHLHDTPYASVITPDGEIIFDKSNRKRIDGRLPIHALQVRHNKKEGKLTIEGSPNAFLYGQNIFTLKDPRALCLRALKNVRTIIPFEIDSDAKERILKGDIDLYRIDIAENFYFADVDQALKILQQIKLQFASQYAKTSTNMSSARWASRSGSGYSITFYDKYTQMLSKKKTNDEELKRLINECRGVIRVELTLRRKELKKLGLTKLSAWDKGTPERIFYKYFSLVPLYNATFGSLTTKELDSIPKKLRRAYKLHKKGDDLKDSFGKSYVKKIYTAFRKLGYDLRCPNQATEAVSLKGLFSEERRMPKPKWLKKSNLWPEKKVKTRK